MTDQDGLRQAVLLAGALLCGLLCLGSARRAKDAKARGATAGEEKIFGELPFRFIGPPGNRVSAVVGVPGDPNTYYVGAASGGVWKSTDAGVHWAPIFDKEPAQSIGSIAIAPSDPNLIFVGTGEPFIRSDVSLGNGIYKSTNAGKTWTHMGLEKTGRIARILIDPKNPDIVLAAALGTCYGPQPERGVYRTTDGGKTWEKTLFVDENTGASDISWNPDNPRTVFAGTWQIEIKTWGRWSGGPGSGVYVSHDEGATWKRIEGHGLPASPLGKIAVAAAPSDSQRVYALIETGHRGSLWRSEDGGESWKEVNSSRLLNERPHYYTRMLVMPDNENEIYFPSNSMGATYDGGETATQIRWGGDNHDMWADPKIPSRMMIGNDLGVMISTNRGKQWSATRLPVGQIYHVATDNRIPYDVYGQMQDDGSMRGPSQLPGGYGIPPALWTSTAGCETGWNIPDPVDPDIVWGGCYAGVVERYDAKTRMTRTVSVWPERTMGAPSGQIKLRMNWTYPIAISPFDHNVVYVGSQLVHETDDAGQTWKTISPDLTRNDRQMMGNSGGLTYDNLSVEYAGVVFSIGVSPLEKGQIWAGTNDGLVQMTRDGGAHWSNVTPKDPKMPPYGTVDSVEPSPFDAGTCYVSYDLHQVDDRDPFIFETKDFGKTWKSISSDIPKSPLSYVHIVKEDPFRKGLLYAGTENGLYVSFDDGGHWRPLQTKLPHAPVYWLTIQPKFHDLVVATYGRGFYILDDVTPLEQLTDSVRADAVHLFAPRAAYRFRAVSRPNLAPAGTAMGHNPPYGASINYWLKSEIEKKKTSDSSADSKTPEMGKQAPEQNKGEKPASASGVLPGDAFVLSESEGAAHPKKEKEEKGPIQITIRDAEGHTVRTLHGSGKAGVNRIWWDLRYAPTVDVKLRTTPPGNPDLWEEKRFLGKDWRPIFYYGIVGPKKGPLVLPGTYTVEIEAEGHTAAEKLTVLKDPNSAGTEMDVEAANKLQLGIYHDINTVAGMINQIEWTRKQIEDFKKMLTAEKADKSIVSSVGDLDAKVEAVEDKLLQPTLAEGDMKSFRGPLALYLKFVWLEAEAGTGGGDVSGNADLRPTQPELEVYDLLSKRLASVQVEFRQMYEDTIPAFNRMMQDKGLERIITVKEPAKPGKDVFEDEDDPAPGSR